MFNQLHAGLAFNLPVKFPKTVESEMESEDFQFFPTVILVPTCVYVSIYTRYSSHTPPPQCPTPPPNPTCPTPLPAPPSTWGWWGVVKHWGFGVLEHRVHQPQSPNFFPHRNPVPKQGEKLNRHRHMLSHSL